MPEKPKTFGSIDAFRTAAKDSEQPIAEARVRGGFNVEVKASDDAESRSLTFTISTPTVDRMGDTIAVDGWKLESFRKNPVVLWAHDAESLPVAKAPKVWIEGGKLKAEAEFTPPGMARFNDTVFDMYKQGFLSAVSVGFMPLRYAFTDDPQRRFGIDFLEQELLEFSAVPVPANAEALVEGRAAGIDIEPLLEWSEEILRKAGSNERIVKLAESVLDKISGNDKSIAVAWAERIVAADGKAVVTRSRLESVERLETAAARSRAAKKRERELDLTRLRASP